MTTDDQVNPYEVFVDVLSYRYTGAHQRALTGGIIAAYAELNHLLGRTKGRLPGATWADCADTLLECTELYEAAWMEFKQTLVRDSESDLRPGQALTRAFEVTLDMLRTALERMRDECGRMGMLPWVR